MSADEAIGTDAAVAEVLSEYQVPPLTRSLVLLKTVSTGNGRLWIRLREGYAFLITFQVFNFGRIAPFKSFPGAPWADAHVK